MVFIKALAFVMNLIFLLCSIEVLDKKDIDSNESLGTYAMLFSYIINIICLLN